VVLSLSSFQKEKIKGKDKKGKYEICCVKGKKVKTLVHAHNNRHVAVHAAHMLYRPNLKVAIRLRYTLIYRGGFSYSKMKIKSGK